MKTILLVDDEQSFISPLADALEYEGHRVIKASSVSEALCVLRSQKIDLITIDIMLNPGPELEGTVESKRGGLYLCHEVKRHHSQIDAFAISVVTDRATIKEIQSLGIRFLKKGETPLRTVLDMFRSRLTGVAYSTERQRPGRTKTQR